MPKNILQFAKNMTKYNKSPDTRVSGLLESNSDYYLMRSTRLE